MGDRANVVVAEGDDKVFLYTHWGGNSYVQDAVRSLGRGRDEDAPYLARIVFCEMIKRNGDLDGETGFGISTRLCDNEHPILVLDVTKQQAYFAGEDDVTIPTAGPWSFEDFADGVREGTIKPPGEDCDDEDE